MTVFRKVWLLTAVLILIGSIAAAQNVISAHSGLVNYTEGDVYLQDKPVQITFGGKYPEMKNGDVLRTAEGRMEVLLNPGVFLRAAENSSIKMLNNRLEDTQIEVLSGSVLVLAGELTPNDRVTVRMKDATVEVQKKALVRLESETGLVKVYDGQAIVARGGQTVTLKQGRQTLLSTLLPEKFDPKETDAFYRWAARRDGAVAAASVVAAKSMYDYGVRGTGWMWLPSLGMFGYVPYGRYYSPFGSLFYTPGMVAGLYDYYYWGGGYYNGYRTNNNSSSGWSHRNDVTYNPSLGYNTAGRSSNVYSNPTAVSSTPATSTTSTSAGSMRGSDAGSSRGSSGAGHGGR